MVGSLIEKAALLQRAFTRQVKGVAPLAECSTLVMEPVGGAILLAVQGAGYESSLNMEQFQHNLTLSPLATE